uniref:Membrane-anchored cell surface protein n=1 Tax=Solanum tuberosum TaxID=4113 RepID=M1AD42_SOLTU
MPSGPKKRRAAKRKNETKQNEEFTTVSVVKVTIPIEELAKGAVWHEATSVDKELDKAKNIIVQVPNEFKAQAKETDVSTKLIEGVDLNEVKNTIEEVSDNSNTVQENNEVDVTSNEDILVSNDDPVLSKATGCIMENVESSGISQENELISDVMKPEENFERYHDLIYDNDNSILDYDKDRGFFFRDVPVVVPGVATDVEVLAANEADTVGKRDIGVVADVSVMDNVIEANEEPLLNVNTNDQDKEILKESQNSSCIVGSVESDVEPHEVKKDTAPLVSVNVMSNESIKEEENNVMIHDQSTEAVEGMNDAAQLVSELPVVFSPPSSNASSAENIELSDSNEMQALPTGAVSTATEDKVTEIPSNLNELLDVLQGTVPRATEKQVYFACPMFFSVVKDELLENVEELKIAIRSLKEDLEKTLDKLDSISY